MEPAAGLPAIASIGIDAGGTFTDFVTYEPQAGSIVAGKVLSTPLAPQEAVIAALHRGETRGAPVRRVVHGTTVGTNALLERKGAQVALLTTRGFRDTLEIGRTRRPEPGLFNTKSSRPAPLVPRCLRLEISERLLADGTVRQPVDRQSVLDACDILKRERPEAVVVCFLHSYANPKHEREVRDALEQALPGTPVQSSADILPEYREYERLSTAVINAYILPRMERYLTDVARHVEADEKRLWVMSSSGGAMSAASAATHPVRTFLSGPAGGVQGAIRVCETAGLRDFITCDMGGTSTDVCLVQDGKAGISRDSMVAGLPLRLPQVEINTVGAGGGSIAFFDSDGLLAVGPRSAAALPGPACYGRGGRELTVTDAAFLLGRIGSSSLLGGELVLDGVAAQAAADRLLAQSPYQIDAHELLEGVIRLAVAKMASAIREISVERGHDPRELTLVPMGGAGPMYATEVAAELGMSRILVPVYPGNMSALGLACSDVRYDAAAAFFAAAASVDRAELENRLEALAEQARRQLTSDGFSDEAVRCDLAVDLRYQGQAFELTVPLQRADEPLDEVTRRFEALYERRYGLRRIGASIEIVALRVAAFGQMAPLRLPKMSDRDAIPAPSRSRRSLYWNGDWHDGCAILHRAELGPGSRVEGPVVVEEYGSTTVILPGWVGTVDAHGNIGLVRSDEA